MNKQKNNTSTESTMDSKNSPLGATKGSLPPITGGLRGLVERKNGGGRKIDTIIVHCSAVRPDQTSTVEQIDHWHKQRGWDGIGYHYLIYRDGSIHAGRPLDKAGAHCLYHNAHSIGVCYEGGLDADGKPADTRTPQQKLALVSWLEHLKSVFPNAEIYGHRDFNPHKSCPCFDARSEYGEL